MSVPGYDFCKVHGFGKLKGVPWYENAIFLAVIVLILSSIVGLFIARHYFLIGPNIENQNKILTKQDEILNIPSITLDIGPVLDPKDPWGTSFVICNQSHQIISNVWAVAYWNDPNMVKKTVFAFGALNPVPRIIPTGKQALHFSGATNLPPFGQKTWVNVDVRFTAGSFAHETNQVFQFCVVRDGAENYLWAYDGEGESLESIKSRMDQQPSQPFDSIPFVDVNVTAVGNDSNTIPEHPFKIGYSWKNIGGQPATKIEIEWGILDPKGGMIHVWSNLWSKAIFDQVFWPGMTNGEVRFYRDKTAPALFNGIVSNSLTLFGSVAYQDIQGVAFIAQVKVIQTNGAFETRYLGIHSKYGDWYAK